MPVVARALARANSTTALLPSEENSSSCALDTAAQDSAAAHGVTPSTAVAELVNTPALPSGTPLSQPWRTPSDRIDFIQSSEESADTDVVPQPHWLFWTLLTILCIAVCSWAVSYREVWPALYGELRRQYGSSRSHASSASHQTTITIDPVTPNTSAADNSPSVSSGPEPQPVPSELPPTVTFPRRSSSLDSSANPKTARLRVVLNGNDAPREVRLADASSLFASIQYQHLIPRTSAVVIHVYKDVAQRTAITSRVVVTSDGLLAIPIRIQQPGYYRLDLIVDDVLVATTPLIVSGG
jgi:hypothetical protein